MTDNRNTDAKVQNGAFGQPASKPAAMTAVALVRDVSRQLDPILMDKLSEAALHSDRGMCAHAIADALSDGVRPEDIADFYIPELARRMGDLWCQDQLGFVDVTIGVSRLQTMLRSLGPAWSNDQPDHAHAPSILLIVPLGADHTLGAMVLAGQLRRRGFSTRLMLGLHNDELAQRVQGADFDAIFISASHSEPLETLREIVNVVAQYASVRPPVVIGGALLEVHTEDDVTAQTGADHATHKIDEALRLCGLEKNRHNCVPLKQRG